MRRKRGRGEPQAGREQQQEQECQQESSPSRPLPLDQLIAWAKDNSASVATWSSTTSHSAMATAPKKKRDFFNGSQGLDLRDFRNPEPHEVREEALVPEGAYALDERRLNALYPNTPSVGVAFPSSPAIGHLSAEFYASCHDRHSPPVGCQSLGEQERCPPITPAFHLSSRGLEFDDPALLSETPAPFLPNEAAERCLWPAPAMTIPPASDGDGDGDDEKKANKRKQRCRLCANHGIYVEIKGHKWYCPYKNPQHTCSKCETTRKRQQMQTREQQQQLHLQGGLEGEAGAEEGRQIAVPIKFPAKPSHFPRMQELLEDTDHILDGDLFRQIDERMRPKATHH